MTGRISDVRLGLSGIGPTAVRALDAEEEIRGEQPAEEIWEKAV